MRFLESILLIVNFAIISATVCSYIVPYFNPRDLGIISYTVLLYPILLLANLFFIFYWTLRRSKKAIFSAMVLLLGWGYIKSFYVIGNHESLDGTEHINIISFNASNFSYNFSPNLKSKTERESVIKDFLKGLDTIDIFCFQEIGNYSLEILKNALPSYKIYQPKKGTAIMTRFPVLDSGIIDFGTFTNSCTWADLNTGKGLVRVYSLHLESNRISADTEKIIEKAPDIEEKLFYDIRDLLRRYKRSSFKRADQVSQLKKHFEECPYPIILAGDFNDTPISYTYKQLSEGFIDSFKLSGRGVGASYAGNIPFLRIDYIMLSPVFAVKTSSVIKKKLSDHYPIYTAIHFPADAENQ